MSESIRATPRLIDLLAFDQVQLLDVAGPLQVFASANELALAQGNPAPYRMRVLAPQAGPLTTSAGLALVAQALPAARSRCDTLLVAGGWGVHTAARDAQLVAWVRRRSAYVRRLGSVCTGAFLLAAAGLLDGRRAVTHWTRCAELAQRYTAIQVEPDPIFLHDDGVWTSAGVSAGIDLALALVEQDLGRTLALAVAQHLVVFLKRPGGQAQFSATLALQQSGDRFAELHDWITAHLAEDLSVARLATQVGMSERSFVRHYRAQTGVTPARAVEQLRLEAARRLLGDGTLGLKRIAARCGFGSEETLRRSFLRALAVTPQAYRARFASPLKAQARRPEIRAS